MGGKTERRPTKEPGSLDLERDFSPSLMFVTGTPPMANFRGKVIDMWRFLQVSVLLWRIFSSVRMDFSGQGGGREFGLPCKARGGTAVPPLPVTRTRRSRR